MSERRSEAPAWNTDAPSAGPLAARKRVAVVDVVVEDTLRPKIPMTRWDLMPTRIHMAPARVRGRESGEKGKNKDENEISDYGITWGHSCSILQHAPQHSCTGNLT